MGRPSLEPGEWGEVSTGGITTGGKVRARTRFCTPANRVITIEASGKSAAEAKRNLKKRINKWQPDEMKALFRDIAKQWIISLEEQGELRPQTIEGYRRTVKNALEPHLGSRTIGSITTQVLNAAFDAIRAESPGNYGPALTVSAGICTFAVQRGFIASSPMVSVTRRSIPTKTVRALELEELAELRRHVREWQNDPRRTQPLLDMVDLALSTGARIGELLAAKWEDVNFEARTLTLWSTQVWVKGKGIVDQNQTKENTVLTLPLTQFAMTMLEDRRERDPEGIYIFSSRKGTMIARSNIDRAWRTARSETFEWVSWHTFRKSVATLAAGATDSQTAAKLLGHTSDKITRKHYIAHTAQAVPDLTAVLEALAGEKAPLGEDLTD